MKKIDIILLIFIFTASFAGKTKDLWRIKVFAEDAIDIMHVYDVNSKSKKPLLTVKAEENFQGFKGAEEKYFPELKKTLLITRWNFGSHSETLKIFDPQSLSKTPLCKILTTWPADVFVKDGKTKISAPLPKYEGDPDPDSVEEDWKKVCEDKRFRASHPSTSQVPQNP